MTQSPVIYDSVLKLQNNCPHVKKKKCFISGQGLYNTYDIQCVGTGSNTYTFIINHVNTTYKFTTADIMIHEWICGSYSEEYGTFQDENDSKSSLINTEGYIDNYGKYYAQIYDGILKTSINNEQIEFSIKSIQVDVNAKFYGSQDLEGDFLECYTKPFVFDGDRRYLLQPVVSTLTKVEEEQHLFTVTGDFYIRSFGVDEELKTVTFTYYAPLHEFYDSCENTTMDFESKSVDGVAGCLDPVF